MISGTQLRQLWLKCESGIKVQDNEEKCNCFVFLPFGIFLLVLVLSAVLVFCLKFVGVVNDEHVVVFQV